MDVMRALHRHGPMGCDYAVVGVPTNVLPSLQSLR